VVVAGGRQRRGRRLGEHAPDDRHAPDPDHGDCHADCHADDHADDRPVDERLDRCGSVSGTGSTTGSTTGCTTGNMTGCTTGGGAGGGAVVAAADLDAVAAQLGRPARGVLGVAHRCGCGLPDVVSTAPRLPDGSPFPTFYYLTCPRAASAVGRFEGAGLMSEQTAELARDPELAAAHRRAHEHYLADREAVAVVPEIAGISAGGMPDRVKCLHVLVAHALAAGPGTNPFGDRVLGALSAAGGGPEHCWGGVGGCLSPTT
jgi:hypothetical protein